jgi:hypothetical protein
VDNSVERLRETPPSLCTTPVDNFLIQPIPRIFLDPDQGFIALDAVESDVLEVPLEG